MSHSVEVPLWLVVLLALLAAWSFLSRLLMPSVRWIWSRRINRMTERINRRLAFKIPPIARTRREVLIDRLVYDPKVLREVDKYCAEEQVPHQVALRRVETYAREIAPAFSTYMYFRVGSAFAKWLASLLYRVRLGHADYKGLRTIAEDSSVVFVMNHRSNMDYILTAYLVSRRVALSYAVGEWAKVWPIQQLIRSMGAYFVRRGSGDALYRRVLERYVQMAVDGGAVQAIFPEGGLSRDGLLRTPKIGLLDYMLRAFDANGERDIVFVPVALNYDRVLEDRTLLLDTGDGGERRSGLAAVKLTSLYLASQLWLKFRGKWYRHGYACANFGTPISLRDYLRQAGWYPQLVDPATRIEKTTALASHLMQCVGRLVPVLPVPLIAKYLLDSTQREHSIHDIHNGTLSLRSHFAALGAHVYVPRGEHSYLVNVGLRMIVLRRFVLLDNDRYRVNPENAAVLKYYANSLAHLEVGTGKT